MIDDNTFQELAALLNNQDFINKLSKCQTEADIIPLVKEFGFTLTEKELDELLAEKTDAMKGMAKVAELYQKLAPVLKNKEKAEEFSKILSYESFLKFCKENDITLSKDALLFAKMICDLIGDGIELSDEALSSVAGGNGVATAAEFGVGLIPCAGGVASAALSIADGSVKGTEKITARLAVGVVASLFDTINTISTGGMLAIGKQWNSEGFSSGVKHKLAIFGGITALSSISGVAVSKGMK